MTLSATPLADPAYVPVNQPVDGVPPAVVAKWGPNSQVRWLARFRDRLKPQPHPFWERFYCASSQHRGSCCPSCMGDKAEGYWDLDGDACCCLVWLDDA